MAEQPVPQDDPVVTKSYAAHYTIAMLLLTASLLWALWDEAYGQRPWKTYQHAWKQRYSAFLNTAKSSSANSQKAIESEMRSTSASSRRTRAPMMRPNLAATRSRSSLLN